MRAMKEDKPIPKEVLQAVVRHPENLGYKRPPRTKDVKFSKQLLSMNRKP